MRAFLALSLLLAPLGAVAQTRAPMTAAYDFGVDVDAVLLSAAEASRTAEFTVGVLSSQTRAANYSKLRVEVNYTQGGAGITALTATPWCKRALDGTYARYTSRSCASGTCTVNLLTDSRTPSGSEVFMLEYDIRGCYQVKVVIAGTGSPHANDAVTVGATAVAGE